MKNALIFIAALLATSSLAVAQQTNNTARTISVTGEAKGFFEPNRALISIGVRTEGKNTKDVKRENDERMQKLMKALERANVKRTDIQTSNISIRPVYEYKSGKQYLVKYTMDNMVMITVRDLDNVSNIINMSVEDGSNVLNNLNFFVAGAEKIRDSLRVEAVKVAKDKAMRIAEAVDMRVGKPMSIDASSNTGYVSPILARQNMANSTMAEDASGSNTEVSGGQIVIKATVSAIFEME